MSIPKSICLTRCMLSDMIHQISAGEEMLERCGLSGLLEKPSELEAMKLGCLPTLVSQVPRILISVSKRSVQ